MSQREGWFLGEGWDGLRLQEPASQPKGRSVGEADLLVGWSARLTAFHPVRVDRAFPFRAKPPVLT